MGLTWSPCIRYWSKLGKKNTAGWAKTKKLTAHPAQAKTKKLTAHPAQAIWKIPDILISCGAEGYDFD